jgi:3-methyladenine DNA glycosylase AlkD
MKVIFNNFGNLNLVTEIFSPILLNILAVLFDFCTQTMEEKDFFIRKAIGWALREYSKTSPDTVRQFIDENRDNLSPLSIREGSKYV